MSSTKKIIQHAYNQQLLKMKQAAFSSLDQRAESRLVSVRKSIGKKLLESENPQMVFQVPFDWQGILSDALTGAGISEKPYSAFNAFIRVALTAEQLASLETHLEKSSNGSTNAQDPNNKLLRAISAAKKNRI